MTGSLCCKRPVHTSMQQPRRRNVGTRDSCRTAAIDPRPFNLPAATARAVHPRHPPATVVPSFTARGQLPEPDQSRCYTPPPPRGSTEHFPPRRRRATQRPSRRSGCGGSDLVSPAPAPAAALVLPPSCRRRRLPCAAALQHRLLGSQPASLPRGGGLAPSPPSAPSLPPLRHDARGEGEPQPQPQPQPPCPPPRLPVAPQGEGVGLLPGPAAAGARLGVEMAPPDQPTVVAAGRGQPPQLAVLVHALHDPVDAGVLQGGGAGQEGV